ncbi:MAG: hypothetical protein WCO09_00755, partial [bacterium]
YYADKKKGALDRGTDAQKKYLGIITDGKGKGNEVGSTSWFRGKNMAMQDVIEKGMKASSNAFTKSETALKTSSQKTLGALEADLVKIGKLIGDTSLADAVKSGVETAFNQADGAHKDIKPEDLDGVVKNMTIPLQKITSNISRLEQKLEDAAKIAASTSSSKAQVKNAKAQMKLFTIQKDRLTATASTIIAAKDKIENNSNKLQEIEISKGTRDAIEDGNKTKTP